MEFPGEKLVIRLWETVTEKGIGGLMSPWQTRREGWAQADIRRNERLVLAQTERDIEDIRSGRKTLTPDGQLLEPPTQDNPLESGSSIQQASVIRRNRIAQEMRAEVNVSKALLSAEAGLEDDPQTPPDRKVDDDWLFRWRDAASTVSSEELQILWGRVIAGEIKSPGSFSLRTLEFLKNLSHEEALQIAKVSPFVINGRVIFRGNKQLLGESEGITFSDLLNLQNLGVVSGVEAVGLQQTLPSSATEKFERALVAYNRVLLVTHEDASKEIRLEIYTLTSLGQQILKLGSFEAHEIYLRSVGQAICRQGFKVHIARWEQVTEETGRYFEPEEICAKTV